MIAGEDDLAACSLRAACQIDASSNLHAGEKSPDFAIKSGLGVSSRVSKVTSAACDRSVYLSERDGRRCPDLCHVEVRDQALGALAGVVRLVRRHLPVELLELRLPLVVRRHLRLRRQPWEGQDAGQVAQHSPVALVELRDVAVALVGVVAEEDRPSGFRVFAYASPVES